MMLFRNYSDKIYLMMLFVMLFRNKSDKHHSWCFSGTFQTSSEWYCFMRYIFTALNLSKWFRNNIICYVCLIGWGTTSWVMFVCLFRNNIMALNCDLFRNIIVMFFWYVPMTVFHHKFRAVILFRNKSDKHNSWCCSGTFQTSLTSWCCSGTNQTNITYDDVLEHFRQV